MDRSYVGQPTTTGVVAPTERNLRVLAADILSRLNKACGRLEQAKFAIQPEPPSGANPKDVPSDCLRTTIEECEAVAMRISNLAEDFVSIIGEHVDVPGLPRPR